VFSVAERVGRRLTSGLIIEENALKSLKRGRIVEGVAKLSGELRVCVGDAGHETDVLCETGLVSSCNS